MRAALIIVAFLSGCAISPEQRADSLIARFGPVCDRLGFDRNTDAWRNCVLQQGGIAQSNAAAYNAAMQRSRTTCTTYGAQTTCN